MRHVMSLLCCVQSSCSLQTCGAGCSTMLVLSWDNGSEAQSKCTISRSFVFHKLVKDIFESNGLS